MRFWLSFSLVVSCLAGQTDDLARLYQEARQAEATKDLNTAALRYEAILKIRPDLAEGFANLGNVYYQQGKPDKAAVAYKKAIALKPQLTGPYFFLGMISFHSRAYPEALRYLGHAAELEPQNPMVQSYLGYTRYAQANYREATQHLEKATADQDVLYHLSKCYGHLAQSSFEKLNRQFPDTLYTHLARAHLSETRQEWHDAAERYQAALRFLPDNIRLQQKAAWAAEKAEGKASVLSNENPDKLIDASLAYLYSPPASVEQELKAHKHATNATTAEQLYREGENYQILSYLASLSVIQLDPQSYRAKQLEAQLLESAGKDEEAVTKYKDVLRLEPKLKNTHFAIGNLYWKQQHFPEAKEELLRELEIDANHPQALYELGDIALTSGNPKEAEQYYLKALKYEPKMVEAHFALEKIYTDAGQYEKSIRYLNSALKIDASDPTPHYRLSRVYQKLGRTAESEKELRLFEAQRKRR